MNTTTQIQRQILETLKANKGIADLKTLNRSIWGPDISFDRKAKLSLLSRAIADLDNQGLVQKRGRDVVDKDWLNREAARKMPFTPETSIWQVHIAVGSRAACNQCGDILDIRPAEEFWDAPVERRCQRCEKWLGIRNLIDDRYTLSKSQERILDLLASRKGRWSRLTDLYTERNDSAITSLHRSIRRLVAKGFVQKKVNSCNRVLVRATPFWINITKNPEFLLTI